MRLFFQIRLKRKINSLDDAFSHTENHDPVSSSLKKVLNLRKKGCVKFMILFEDILSSTPRAPLDVSRQ